MPPFNGGDIMSNSYKHSPVCKDKESDNRWVKRQAARSVRRADDVPQVSATGQQQTKSPRLTGGLITLGNRFYTTLSPTPPATAFPGSLRYKS